MKTCKEKPIYESTGRCGIKQICYPAKKEWCLRLFKKKTWLKELTSSSQKSWEGVEVAGCKGLHIKMILRVLNQLQWTRIRSFSKNLFLKCICDYIWFYGGIPRNKFSVCPQFQNGIGYPPKSFVMEQEKVLYMPAVKGQKSWKAKGIKALAPWRFISVCQKLGDGIKGRSCLS